jgi:hypothetical protein
MSQFVSAAVVAIGFAIGGPLGGFILLNATEITLGLMVLGGMALSYEQQRAAQAKAKAAYNAGVQDRMANIVTTIGPRELVLGRVRKAGTVFGRVSTGTNHTNLYIAIAIAAHEIDAVETIYLNDKPVTLDGVGNVTSEPYALPRKTPQQASFTGSSFTIPEPTFDTSSVTVTRNTGGGVDGSGSSSIPFTLSGNTVTIGDSFGGDVTYQSTATDSKVKVTWHLGAAGQTVDPDINAAFPTDWDASHTATGVAYLVVRCTYDETAFPSGLPSVSAVIRGAKVYDPRSGLTAWSDNPALLMRHVLTHPQFGKRTSISAAEDARIIAAANACDTSVTYTVGGVGTTRALYTAGTVLPFGNPAKACLDDLAQAMAGMWAYAGGQFYCKAGVYTAPVLALTDADLAVVKTDNSGQKTQQAITIGTHQARASKVNVITPRIWDAAQDYKEVALSPLVASTLVTRDGCWLAQEVTMPAITYSAQALHVAGITIRDARDPLTVTLPFKMTAYPLELFDSITLTIPRYGWSAKEFMVLGRQWTLDGLIMLTLKETASAIFQMDASFSAQGYATNTNLPTPWTVSPPSNVVVASGPSNLQLNQDGTVTVRVKVSWDAITDSSILNGGSVEVQYRLASETLWHSVTVPGDSTFVYLIGANPGDVGFVQVRTKNRVAVSDWCTMISHTVTGKSAGPGTPTSFTATGIAQGIHLACTLPTDVDLAYVELWRNTSNNVGTATKIAQGLRSTYDDLGLTAANGTLYYWVRAVNTTGIAGTFSSVAYAVAGLTTTPSTISTLAAASIIGGIRVTCTLPTDADLAGLQLYENTTNNSATATLIATGLTDHYDRLGLLPSNGTRYYWVKCVNTSGTVGAFSNVANAVAGTAVAANISSVTWSTVTGTGKPADNADVTTTILGASGTSIVMTNANLFKSGSGAGGVFIGSGGLYGKDSGGVTTFSIDGATGAAYFKGTLDLNGTNGLLLTSSGNVGKVYIDSNGFLVIQGTAANKQIRLFGPTNGGLAIDDYTTIGQTLVKLFRPGATNPDGTFMTDGTNVQLISTGMGMKFQVGTIGGNTLEIMAGGFTFSGSASLVKSITTSSSAGGLSLTTTGGTGSTPSIALSGTPTSAGSAGQISNSGHTYTFSGGNVAGSVSATFSGLKPGTTTGNNGWMLFVIDGTNWYVPMWQA